MRGTAQHGTMPGLCMCMLAQPLLSQPYRARRCMLSPCAGDTTRACSPSRCCLGWCWCLAQSPLPLLWPLQRVASGSSSSQRLGSQQCSIPIKRCWCFRSVPGCATCLLMTRLLVCNHSHVPCLQPHYRGKLREMKWCGVQAKPSTISFAASWSLPMFRCVSSSQVYVFAWHVAEWQPCMRLTQPNPFLPSGGIQ